MSMSRIAVRLSLAAGIVALYFLAAISYEANPWAMFWMLSAVAVLALGTFVVLKGPRLPLNRAFFLFALCLSSYLLLVYLFHMATVWGIRNVSGVVWLLRNGNLLAPACLMYVAYHFVGGENRFLRTLARLSTLSTLPFVILNMAGRYITEYRLVGSCYLPANAHILYCAYAVVTLLWLLTFWLIILVGTFLRSSRPRRPQFVLFLLGSSLALTAAIASLMPAFREVGFPAGLGLAHIGFPLVLGIAVLRFGMFDVRIVLRKTLPYAIGTVLIGGLYALYLGIFETVGHRIGSVPTGVNWVVIFSLVGLGFQPLLTLLQNGLDRLFFQTEAEAEHFLAQAGPKYRDAGSATAVSRMLAADARKALRLEGATVCLGSECVSRVLADSWGGELGEVLNLALPLAGTKRQVILADDSGTLDLGERAAELSHALRKAGAAAAVPFGGDGTVGLLVCRAKLSGLPFSPQDAMFLRALVAQAEMAMTGLRAKEDADAATRLTDALFEVMANPVALVDPEGRVDTCNPAFERTFGPGGQVTVSELGLGDVTGGDAFSGPAEAETPKGTFLVSARPLDERQGERKTLVVMIDVTDLRRLQEADRRRSALAELGAAISSINHEIMNILSPVDFYLRKVEDAGGDERPAAVAVVRQRIEALDRLCRDLRAYYRPPTLSLRKVSLRDVVENTLADLAQTRGPAWVPPRLSGIDMSVVADPQKLKQVLLNIVKNAWEAMDGGREKSWSIEATSSDDGHALIRITDSGPGIPPDIMKRLFQPLLTTKADRGTGLGLAVARRIAEAHGAEITVESPPGKGTTVTLRWPMAR